MSSLLEIKNLSKTFDNKKILDNVNLEIEKGRIVGLLGKNGAGKSTLIKIINDLLTMDDGGVVLFKGKKIGVYSKEHISYLPERTYLDKSMKVSSVISYFKEFYKDFNEKKAYALLKDLNLDSDIRISKMSKGMQEKLQLVLVMSRDADLYILDEPLSGVDPATRDYILDTILSNFKEGSSIIISTHLISDIERILDDVVFIDKGKVVISSSADELRTKEKASIDDIFRREFKC
jgi:ABC-2 type transport system ATP-binding protein